MDQKDIKNAFDKGIILGPTINKERYICPKTGAHFEIKNMCERILAMAQQRAIDYDLGSQKQQSKQLKEQMVMMRKQKQQEPEINQSYQNKNRQITQESYKSNGPQVTNGGYQNTQEDMIDNSKYKPSQNGPNTIKKTKEISQALYQANFGQMIKMKSHHNARNQGPDLKSNFGVPAQPQQAATYMMQGAHKQNFTEGDEQFMVGQNFGGSFDNREKIQDIKQRHLAGAAIPQNKIQYKKGSQNASKTATIRASQGNHQRQSTGPDVYQDGFVVQSSQFSNQNISAHNYNTQPSQPYQDNSASSHEDSIERKSGDGYTGNQRRILTQPERVSHQDVRREPSQESTGEEQGNHQRVAQLHVRTSAGHGHSNSNPSKRLSQKSSSRQFQANQNGAPVSGFSPNRKIGGLGHVSNYSLQRNMVKKDDNMLIYRQVEDSRNQSNGIVYKNQFQAKSTGGANGNQLSPQIGGTANVYSNNISKGNDGISNSIKQQMYMSMGNAGQAANQRTNLSGNNRINPVNQSNIQAAATFYGGMQRNNNSQEPAPTGNGQQMINQANYRVVEQGNMSKTGMSFQKRMQNISSQKSGSVGVPGKPIQVVNTAHGGKIGQKNPQVIGHAHRRQYSTNVGTVGGAQINSSNFQGGGVQQQNAFYDKGRGRNSKGQGMFQHNNVGISANTAGSDIQQYPATNTNQQTLHQRNKTQIMMAGNGEIQNGTNDSIFRSSIMSTDQIQKVNKFSGQPGLSIQQMQNNNNAINKVHQRQSAKPGGRQQQQNKAYSQMKNSVGNGVQTSMGVPPGINGSKFSPPPREYSHNSQQNRVHSGDPRQNIGKANNLIGGGNNNKQYLQTDGSQGSQGQQNNQHNSSMNAHIMIHNTHIRRPSGKQNNANIQYPKTNKIHTQKQPSPNINASSANFHTGSQTLKVTSVKGTGNK